jgi:hypothetical protein
MPTRINLPLFGENKNRNPGPHIIFLNCIGIKKNVSKSANDLLVWVINNQQNNKCPAMAQRLRPGYPSPVRNLITSTLAIM